MAEEKRFENKIKAFLKNQNCYHVKYFANRNTRSGVPDILACINGRFVGIEVKANKGKVSELQRWNLIHIRNSGGIGLLVFPSDWEVFIEKINEIMEVRACSK